MKTLKEMLLNEIEKQPRGYANILAEISGSYSSGSNLTKVLKGEKKEFASLNGLLKIVKFSFPEYEIKLMSAYSKELDPNNQLARHMLEYLYCNRQFDDMSELIEKMLNCKNDDSIEWAKLYKIQYNWNVNYHDLDVNEIIKSVNEFKTNILELNTLIKILKCNSFYKKKMFKISLELSHDIKDSLEGIKEDYIKMAYTAKYNEIMSYLSLRVHNKPLEAEEYADSVLEINVCKAYNAYAMYIKGCSKFYTSYDEAKECFNQSIEIYELIKRDRAADDIREIAELLEVVWDKDISEVKYSKEYNQYWLVRNNQLNVDIENLDLDEPFYYLIKGMKDNNIDSLMQSLIRFVKRGDTFLGTLPKLELIKRGFSDIIINEIINVHV